MEDWGDFIADLGKMVDGHALWGNALLRRMRDGELTESEWGYVCGHQLRYSSQFTRFLGALISRIPAPEHRKIAIRNLIEEQGDGDPQNVHSNILKRLVVSRFGEGAITPDDAAISDELAANYLQLIASFEPVAGAAVLAFGCEILVPRLYRHFVDGMRECGFSSDELVFFTLHIDCDDGHAQELIDLMRALMPDHASAYIACRAAVLQALDARHGYYNALQSRLTARRAMDGVAHMLADGGGQGRPCLSALKTSLQSDHPCLYRNDVACDEIGFHVSRLDVPSTVLDPRLLEIRPGMRSEFHRHAHESLFFVLAGRGTVRIGDDVVAIRENDFVYVPRWVGHQTINTGSDEIKILAITDFGLTRRFAGNTEISYRLRQTA